MLSSPDKFLTWGKRDRAPPAPFFRMLARQWRPAVKKPVVEEAETDEANKTAAMPKGKTLRPVWTPWLWVGK
jgi:hypothetical protein